MKKMLFLLLISFGQILYAQPQTGNPELADNDTFGYLYCHVSEHGGWVSYAMSQDGIHFHDMLCGDAVLPSELNEGMNGSTPFICRALDGGFIMVAAGNSGVKVFRSDDLIDWTGVATIRLPRRSKVGDAKIIAQDGGYMLYFPMSKSEKKGYMDLYGIRTDVKMSKWAKPKRLGSWGFDVKDIIIYPSDEGGYTTLFQRDNAADAIFVSKSESLAGKWSEPSVIIPEPGKNIEGPAAFRLKGTPGWQLGYVCPDAVLTDRYRICTVNDGFADPKRPQYLEGVYGPDKGSFIRVSEAEYRKLQAWSDAEEPKHLAPSVNNPVFQGLHADPEALYSEQTGKYYIYPTTDGAFGWHNHDFKCFSSTDLKNWKDEGVILDLHDLDWGKEYAWAPCIIEKKVGEGYKYYYYFVANKSIGVAVADKPEGPYHDALGKALLTKEEINAPNQVIDPDVFHDPASGKYYLYWGNSYLWMAELADDMISLVPGTMRELIPRSRIGEYHYLEGTHVFERDGLYYFTWSENITRSARYCIRYLISESPTEFVRNGKPAKVEEQIILQQDPSLQIFGTGHHSVLNVPGTDQWYMVYHRFTRPEGIKMGLSGGYNRETCIDPMYFRPDGTIVPVVPTL